jgi:hypothetical protein
MCRDTLNRIGFPTAPWFRAIVRVLCRAAARQQRFIHHNMFTCLPQTARSAGVIQSCGRRGRESSPEHRCWAALKSGDDDQNLTVERNPTTAALWMRLDSIRVVRIGNIAARVEDVLEVRLDAPAGHDLRLISCFEHRFVIADWAQTAVEEFASPDRAALRSAKCAHKRRRSRMHRRVGPELCR